MTARGKGEIRDDVLTALSEGVDGHFSEHSFLRNRKSFDYKRRREMSVQRIAMECDIFPKFSPGAEVFLYPYIRIEMPQVGEIISNLTDRNQNLTGGYPELILNQPLEILIGRKANWYATGLNKIEESIYNFRRDCLPTAIDLLDKFTKPEHIISLDKNSDTGLIKQDRWYIALIAACVAVGDLIRAQIILKEHLGTEGKRKRYECIHSRFQKYLLE